MSQPAKDINSLYSSYNLVQHQYIETTENESYSKVKNKWLVLQSQRDYVGSTLADRSSKSVALTTETV
ncbi:MAG TPA: hypothetical protein DCS35_06265 [Vibrio sp.]|nr:hypothetical protein [Vibrio sp.]